MKQLYSAILTLSASLVFFLLAINVNAAKLSGSMCTKSCGSTSTCRDGNPNLECAWTDCDIIDGSCFVYGAYCCC